MTRTARRVGIVLLQLGGPDTLEAIEPFLYNLFCDPDIIDFPFARIGRKPLAKLISTTRARARCSITTPPSAEARQSGGIRSGRRARWRPNCAGRGSTRTAL